MRHPTLRATFLANNEAVDTRARLWDAASDTGGRGNTRHMEIFVVYTARTIRVVPFISLGDRRPSVPLRDFAFDMQAPSLRSKVLLRDVAGAWLAQVRRDHSEMAHLFGLLLEELVFSNPAARKRNLLYGLSLRYSESCTADTLEQHMTISFESDHPPRCRLNDDHRVDGRLSSRVVHDLMQNLRRHF